MASPVKLAHVVFRTGRFDEMVAWYRDVFEADVAYESPFLTFLTYDDEHHRFAFLNDARVDPAAPRPSEVSGLEHVAFTYASLDDLIDTYERLRARGIEPYWRINHGPTTSLYYRDPDGNQLELQIDNFDDVDALHAWFRSGAFDANPIGVEVDFDDLISRYRAGTPVADLVVRP